jgi:hypothetical protein
MEVIAEIIGKVNVMSDKPLPVEVSEGMNWSGDLKDLIDRKQEEKNRITREMVKLKQERKKQ